MLVRHALAVLAIAALSVVSGCHRHKCCMPCCSPCSCSCCKVDCCETSSFYAPSPGPLVPAPAPCSTCH